MESPNQKAPLVAHHTKLCTREQEMNSSALQMPMVVVAGQEEPVINL